MPGAGPASITCHEPCGRRLARSDAAGVKHGNRYGTTRTHSNRYPPPAPGRRAILGGTTARRGRGSDRPRRRLLPVGHRRPPLPGLHLGPGRGDARPLPPGAEPGHCRAGRNADLLPQLPLQRRARPLRRPSWSKCCRPISSTSFWPTAAPRRSTGRSSLPASSRAAPAISPSARRFTGARWAQCR